MIALLAAGHVFAAQGKLLFMLPATAHTCEVTQLRYGPASRKWERGTNPPQGSCEFQQYVEPGEMMGAWADPGPTNDALEVTYQLKGEKAPRFVTLKPEPVAPPAAPKLSAKAEKVKDRVKVSVKNEGEGVLLAGDAIAARGKPKDDCVGNGATVAIAPGETLVDIRPNILSPSMQVFVAVFSGDKDCKWLEVKR